MTSVLNEALEVVTGPRQEAYGDPVVTCERIGRVWSGILGLDYDLPAATVSALMVGLKMVRETSGEGSRDNWVDAAGYAHIGALAREDAIPFDEPLPEGRTVFEGVDLRSDGPPCDCSKECSGCARASDLEAKDVRLRAERAAWEEWTKVSLTPFSVNAAATSADELARCRHNAAISSAANGCGPYPRHYPSAWVNDESGAVEAAVRREAKEAEREERLRLARRPFDHIATKHLKAAEAEQSHRRLVADAEREEKLRLAKHFSQGIRPARLRVER